MSDYITFDLPCMTCGYNLRGLQPANHCPKCGQAITGALDSAIRRSSSMPSTSVMKLSGFDKFCAVLAMIFAVLFLILGVIGLFAGCSANFTLPPILGVIPGLIGWGIFRSVRIAMSRA